MVRVGILDPISSPETMGDGPHNIIACETSDDVVPSSYVLTWYFQILRSSKRTRLLGNSSPAATHTYRMIMIQKSWP